MLRPLIMDRWVCTLSLSSEWSDGLKLKLCLRSYPNRSEFRFHELITKSDSRLTAASHLERRELAVYSIYYRRSFILHFQRKRERDLYLGRKINF